MNRVNLPGTAGPWFTYWLEYIPEQKLGRERKLWFRTEISKLLAGDPLVRTNLSDVTSAQVLNFLETKVFPHYEKEEAAMLQHYFHNAMVAARNLGGAESYTAKRLFSKRQQLKRKFFFVVLAAITALVLVASTLTVDRMVRKQESFLTAAATVFRENGLGVVVAFAEDIYYSYVKPARVGGLPTTGPSDSDEVNVEPVLPAAQGATVANNSSWGPAGIPSLVPGTLISPVQPIAGEGQWKPTRIKVNGNSAIWIARIRPDEVHTSYWATVTWFDPRLVAFAQVPGTKVPEVSGLKNRTGQVPSNLKSYYVAGLNGGFLMRDSQGGYQLGSKVYQKLVSGKASLVTYQDGSLDVIQWGRDVVRPDVQSVRQNMELIVDGGVNQVDREDQSKWGWVWQGVGSGKNRVWRSAMGIRADGTVIYVMGEAMSAKSLGDVLVRAGVRRAILLDMNEAYANGFLYGPYKNGKKLDPASPRSPERFWLTSERDFIAVFAKSPTEAEVIAPQ
jgi:hypothetical protein